MEKLSNVRTRFAPSPTGHLHIGGLRTALYKYLFARHHGGKFVLRIEDTDQSRSVEGSQQEIIDTLTSYGLDYDEGPDKPGEYGPYIQSQRLEIYTEHALRLAKEEKAYWCSCSSEQLTEMRERQRSEGRPPGYDGSCRDKKIDSVPGSAVLRMRVPEDRTISFIDIIRGEVSFNTADVDDQVLLKSDGFPTYHLASVVDDHLMSISHVIRGEEWLSSTPKHILLYEFFGWDTPEFAHLPLILSEGGGKLSKRSGHASAIGYLQEGYMPEAVINFLALLGFNPRGDQEIYTMQQLVDEFDLSKVNKAGAIFSPDKLRWIATEHIKKTPADVLAEKVRPFLEQKEMVIKNEQWLQRIMEIEKQRISKMTEVGEETSFAFADNIEYDSDILVWKKSDKNEAVDRLQKVVEMISKLEDEDFVREKLEERTLTWISYNKLGNGNTLWPLRVALTGREKSPSPFDAMWILGKAESLKRVNKAIEKLGG